MIIHVHKRESPYVQIDKRALEDMRLSWRAKGILAYLLSKPNGWQVQAADLLNHGTEGRDAIRSAMNELRELGYAELEMLRGEGGLAIGRGWIIHESPIETERRKDGKSGLPLLSKNESDRDNEQKGSKNDAGEPKGKGRKVPETVSDADIDAIIFPEPLNDRTFNAALKRWRSHKIRRGESLTRYALGLLAKDKDCGMLGLAGAIAAIDHSISKNWQGVYPPKSPVNSRTKPERTISDEEKTKIGW